jgi:trimethylamine--corrinoid protein Co-methyltransferase
MTQEYRKGTMVKPVRRMSEEQLKAIHQASVAILDNPGITCFNEEAASVYSDNGCTVSRSSDTQDSWHVRIPAKVVEEAVQKAPEEVILGARKKENSLQLNAKNPRVYFGTGSETNIFLDTEIQEFVNKSNPEDVRKLPVYIQNRGSIPNLCKSAKLCNRLENVDFYIRNVNLQDEGITPENKDVNVFFASLLYMQKHVMAGLVDIQQLDTVIRLAELMADSPEDFKANPLVSFITCIIKSPLQMVEDTTDKLLAIAKKGVPVVLSSSPQGGSTAPVREEGMVSMINAEILAGITLAQLVNPGTPVLYGAVPVRARLDNLHDLYGAPEFIHYNQDCIQMAEHYGVPCYSTAGVGDAKVPGMQATIEKVFSQLAVAQAGAQYIHYAFGLLDKTNIFSPLQAVLDDEHIGIVRHIIRQATFGQKEAEDAVKEVQNVTGSSTQLFARYIRKARRLGLVSAPYAFETSESEDQVMTKAHERLQAYWAEPSALPESSKIDSVYSEIKGLLPKEKFIID